MAQQKSTDVNVITMESFQSITESEVVCDVRKAGKHGMIPSDGEDNRDSLLLENEHPAAGGWGSHCFIDRCEYAAKEGSDGTYIIYLSARADMKERCQEIGINLLVKQNRGAGTVRNMGTKRVLNAAHLCCAIIWEFSGSKEALNDFMPYAEFTWTDGRGTHFVQQVKERIYPANDELIARYQHAWPKKEERAFIFKPGTPKPVPVYGDEKTPPPFSPENPGSYVTVALLREPEDLRDCDYVCYVGRYPGTDKPYIQVPFFCKLTASKNWLFKQLFLDDSYCLLIEKGNESGAVKMLSDAYSNYEESSFVFTPSDDRRTATVSLITPWKDHTVEVGGMKRFFYDMDIHMEIQMENSKEPSETNTAILHLSSREDRMPAKRAETECRLYPVALMWGCLAEDTMITMADGSERPIHSVKMGDFVMSGNGGRPMRVENIWKGMEENLIFLKTKNGLCARMTASHPVYQGSGFISAGQLKPGDVVRGENGGLLTVSSVEIVPYDNLVYNLDLSTDGGEAVMLAGGIAVGDNRVQNER